MTHFTMRRVALSAAVAGGMFCASGQAFAVQCQPPGGFPAFIAAFRHEAAAQGIGQRGLAALDGLKLDRKVLAADHRQGVFRQSFEQFSRRMISRYRMTKGKQLMHRYADTFARVEQRYGVPPGILVAIWAMETDFGANQGHYSVVRSVATLAYDCRRSEKFQGELMAALRIVDRGYMSAHALQGLWAGEIGQTQFLPSSYLKYAVNFDGRGGPDLIHSVPDVLASTANYLQQHGWQRGQGWDPGEPNFAVIKTWNKADVYARTIALFADELEGGSRRAADVVRERR
ncbi:MAG TPA: lytic murein transglycosylase [Pseudolabrys sp.]|nr:lytic murein transglycosylase [Pseudolabrys sp.]